MTNPRSWPMAGHEWTLFLDRDGVINERIPGDYVRDIQGFRWLPGVLQAMPLLAEVFGRIIIVTNQQGVGLGLMTSEQLETIHQYMLREVEKVGGRIDAVLSCTMLHKQLDNCRKPGTGMALQAKQLFPEIDFDKSIMVGDTESDILFGKNVGMLTVMVGDEFSRVAPDFRMDSLENFAKMFSHPART